MVAAFAPDIKKRAVDPINNAPITALMINARFFMYKVELKIIQPQRPHRARLIGVLAF